MTGWVGGMSIRETRPAEAATNLIDPAAPLLGSPRIVHPEKSALKNIFAEAKYFLVRELGPARVLDEQEGTSE